MRLGLVAYAENTGLGSQTKAYYDNLKPYRTMVLNREGSRHKQFYPERYPAALVVNGLPSYEETDGFLDGLDLLLLAEDAPTQYMLQVCQERNIKTVIVPNFEYFAPLSDHSFIMPDFLLPASKWHFDDYPDPKMYFPMPLTPQYADRLEYKQAKNFVHIAGRPVHPDRNGTLVLYQALQYIKTDVTVTFRCQVPGTLDMIAHEAVPIPLNVTVVMDTQDHANEATLYGGQQVLVMPRRYGGLCLPANEALGRAMPVIMPDISPNNSWLPKHWLTPAHVTDQRQMANLVDVYQPDPQKLAELIDTFADSDNFYRMSVDAAMQLADDYSWERLGPKLLAVLEHIAWQP